MDMGSMSGMSSMNSGETNGTTASMMNTAFTTKLAASNLWFSTWTPTTAGSTFGACLGLFFLAILSRFLSAVKACAEVAWAQSIQREHRQRTQRPPPLSSSPSSSSDATGLVKTLSADDPALAPSSPPATPSASAIPALPFSPAFHLSIDLPRALLFGLQSFIAYLLMLAVMTFDAWFFIAILLGFMAGEVAFGRFIVLLGGGLIGHSHGGPEGH
ncbi:hypothetical protein JCM5296_007437 [Sporobolomyces johnsonii]